MFARKAAQRLCVLQRAQRFSTSATKPVTPDFTTSVNIADHKLAKPVRKTAAKHAAALEKLAEGTKVSLIDETLRHMEEDEEFKLTAANLKKMGQKKLTREEKKQRARALDDLGIPTFEQFVIEKGLELKRQEAYIFQMNIGLYCNQACNHCHVESSPKRTEMMDRKTADRCLEIIRNSPSIQIVDITGGAPEMNDQFRHIVIEATKAGKTIIDRCNLTVLTEPGQEDLADFLAEHKVRVVASLPCYSSKNVNFQRGSGVFEKSIQGLVELNKRGYGTDPALGLDLVYNPLGPFLPPNQEALKAKYKEELMDLFGIEFNDLFCITNMPIKRFADFLFRRGELQEYMSLLVRNFNPSSVSGLMCLNHVNVAWNGRVYDCDFNQQLDLPLGNIAEGSELSVFDFESTNDLLHHPIAQDSHCFGCTSGEGSSCQGATI